MQQPVNILIVEDEAIVAMALEENLIGEGYNVTNVVDNGEDAIRSIHDEKTDLLLMDIHIKGHLDGIQTAAAIRESSNVPLIFLTAYSDSEIIQRAKIVNPSAYLVKPYQLNNLKASIDVALYNNTYPQNKSEAIPPADQLLCSNKYFFVKDRKSYTKIELSDIQYIFSEGHYVQLWANGRKHLIRQTLPAILEKLHQSNCQLIRTHRSYAINMDYVEKFFDSEIILKGNISLPLSASYKDSFFNYLQIL